MHDYEERIDDIEVMLGRMIIENDKAQRRQEKTLAALEASIDRYEKQAEKRAELERKALEEWRKTWEKTQQEERQNWQERQQTDQLNWARKQTEEYKSWKEQQNQAHQEWMQKHQEEQRSWKETQKEVHREWVKQQEEVHQQWAAKWAVERKAEQQAWNKRWGELSDKMGTFVEDIVAPNIPRIAKQLFDCEEIDDFMVRRTVRNKKDPSKRREFDVIAVCGDKVLLNETKSSIRLEYIDRFIEILPQLPDYFPEYANKTLVPVFSSLGISQDIVNYLSKHRIYALAMGDENMQLLNQSSVENY